MNQLSSFIEDKTKIPIGTTTLIAQAGIRFTTLFIDKQANRDNIFMKEPRFNLEYTILNRENNSLFDNLSITSGFGLASKAPTLLYLYPEKAYFDATSLATFLGGDIDRSMCIMTTKVIDDTSNPALKPATTKKFELGISGNIHKISGNINFFYEKTENEFGFSSIPFIMNYKLYNIPSGVESLNYTNGMLYYYKDGVQTAATTTPDFFFYTYKRPSNLYETTKKGVEYSFNLGEIKALKTSLVVDGAWLYIKRLSTQAQYVQINSYYKGEKYPYMPIMPAGEGSINERINTNFRLITHIPKLKMIFSTTAQVIWKQSSQNIYEDKNGNELYYKTADPLSNYAEKYFVNPLGFIDQNGNYTAWSSNYDLSNPNNSNVQLYRTMMLQYGNSNYFGKENYPVSIIFNFRMTKEIGKTLELSFLANNFLKIRQTTKRQTAYGYEDLSIPLYFGAEIKVKI